MCLVPKCLVVCPANELVFGQHSDRHEMIPLPYDLSQMFDSQARLVLRGVDFSPSFDRFPFCFFDKPASIASDKRSLHTFLAGHTALSAIYARYP